MLNKKRFLPIIVRPSVAKQGQVTIFIIIAVIIVAAVALYFIFGGTLRSVSVPASLQPAYTNFLSCLEENAATGIGALASRGGYIDAPNYEAGTSYMPFGSQLNFLGTSIPYWYYVSGNGIQNEQVPSRGQMQRQLEDYVESRIGDCDFQEYYDGGVVVALGDPSVDVKINKDNVEINLNMGLSLEKGDDAVVVRSHKKVISSKLGQLYDSALELYNYEQSNLFLENYTIDFLRVYAPVDGIELSCAPQIWSADKVFDDLQIAIEQNTAAIGSNLGNGYYSKVLPSLEGIETRFITSKAWPYTFEVNPSDDNVMIADPIGNQPGLGILGFCYVPYHFVYNLRYPVLATLESIDTGEVFQFPIAIIIEGNKPREALEGDAVLLESPELCGYKNTQVEVKVYNLDLNPVEANISYRCFGEVCSIGETSSGILREDFPQCANGYIVAKSDGYKEGNLLYSTTESGSVNIFLDKLYEMDVDLNLNNQNYNGDAIISFVSEDDQLYKTIIYPGQKTVELGQGQYEVQVYIYKNSSIQLQESTTRKCLEIPESGLGGFFGLTREKCYDIVVPAQIISTALSGGGKQGYFILEDELIGSDTIEINAQSLPVPTSIEQLQDNYAAFEENGLGITFR